MQVPRDAVLLRIFLGEDERCQNRPLYEAIVLKAREMHLAGATVLRGPLGFGHSSRLHTAKILRLSEDLPMVIEIVDSEEKIEAFPSGPRRHDRQRPRHAREGQGASVRDQLQPWPCRSEAAQGRPGVVGLASEASERRPRPPARVTAAASEPVEMLSIAANKSGWRMPIRLVSRAVSAVSVSFRRKPARCGARQQCASKKAAPLFNPTQVLRYTSRAVKPQGRSEASDATALGVAHRRLAFAAQTQLLGLHRAAAGARDDRADRLGWRADERALPHRRAAADLA